MQLRWPTANFQAGRICIKTFGRDDQQVNCKKLPYPSKEKTLIFQQCLPASNGECRIKREQNDDCFMATSVYRLTQSLQEKPQRVNVGSLSDKTNHGSRVHLDWWAKPKEFTVLLWTLDVKSSCKMLDPKNILHVEGTSIAKNSM